MERLVPVNDILLQDITKLNFTLVPPIFQGDVREMRSVQENLCKLIDAIGEQSAAAQGLNRIITTADKLRKSPSHTLYLLKDSLAKNGQGEVIGCLKVGRKHLYLFDQRDQVREVEPICVLDFYVVRDRQRSGYGRVLFDHMLQDLEVNVYDLAIDGPSVKMEHFLSKNYGMNILLRQANNFAIAPEFFDGSADLSYKSGRGAASPVGSGNRAAAGGRAGPGAVAAGVGRFAASKPHSSIANVIHGGAPYYENKPGSEGEEEMELWDCDEMPVASPAHSWEQQAAELKQLEAEAGYEGEAMPAAGLPSGSATPARGEPRRDTQLTDKGYFDVKFYHNRLW